MGILSHHLVQSGFTGERDGLGSVFGGVVSEHFEPREMTRDLGARFEVARNYFKKHACCRHCHPALDALEEIFGRLRGGRVSVDRIATVEVKTYSLAAQLHEQNPRNSFAARFSIPFCMATYLVHSNAGVRSFNPENLKDPTIKGLCQKVSVAEDPEFTLMLPAKRPARVRVTLLNGEVFEGQSWVAKGDSEFPYTHEEKRSKFIELVGPIWSHQNAQDIYSKIMNLDRLQDLDQITGQPIRQ
jgi:2-methylcitrate dehydratase PrpD